MKKNKKGFFLAETIVMIALVTTVMAFVYPNVTSLYDNFENRTKYYDQTEDLYLLMAIRDELDNNGKFMELTNGGCDTINLKNVTGYSGKYGLKNVYVSSYMSSPSSTNYNFNKYLKRMKKTTNDTVSYRLIGEFNDGRYASVKIDNPDPNRSCNLGGSQ